MDRRKGKGKGKRGRGKGMDRRKGKGKGKTQNKSSGRGADKGREQPAKKAKSQCRWFNTPDGCERGDKSRFAHNAQAAPPMRALKRAEPGGIVRHEPPTKRAKPAAPSASACAEFLIKNEIVIDDADAPLPCISLECAPFPDALVTTLVQQPGFSVPSAIQASTWPLANTGRDVLAIAKTGSGKTLGFLLPALTRCQREKASANGQPICLVMAPTRELALQIAKVSAQFGPCVGCRSVAVYGGAKKQAQVKALQRGCELIVATPGRMMDMLGLNCKADSVACTSLTATTMLVLDEADRMIDIGFERDIRRIAAELPDKHQTMLFTATWDTYDISGIQQVADELMAWDKVMVTVGTGGEKLTANRSVVQRVHVVNDAAEKFAAFQTLLVSFRKGQKDYGKRVIIFSNTKADVKWLCNHCRSEGFSADSISGDRSQSQRESTLRRFREGSVTMVIATDVAARGLDVQGIMRVINYDFPGPDDYIHRIGRTGRAGAMGEADTLFAESDKVHATELIRIMNDAGQGQHIPPGLAGFTSQKITFLDSDSEE